MTIRLQKPLILLGLLVLLSASVLGQNRNEKLIKVIESYSNEKGTSYFETSEEMFKLMSKRVGAEADPRVLQYFQKTKYVSSLQVGLKQGNDWFVDSFEKKTDLSSYSLLMRGKSATRNYKFYKRDLDDKYSEYLLVHRRGVYFMITAMDISTLEEMAGVVEMVSEAGQ
ncbi:DUF4252 domain-containing protein [Roseivirga sp. 4D4]|uniref:DUF4252 domain-containing protein n=1 Tax=Roseivirga sp. 4D4 TaxID=1889784 RepID=UPI00147B52DB|nr:DUF4252 domain-containing protein [Roseivirga sp. 4D4]